MESINVLYICNYAAKYSGNFIASLSALSRAVGEGNRIYYLFPDAAHDKSWLSMLSKDGSRILFCEFSVKSLRVICKQLAIELKDRPTIVHTHFVEDALLLPIKNNFDKVICHYHMTVPDASTFRRKVKRIMRQFVYRNVTIVGVSEAVTVALKNCYKSAECECITNAIDFSMLDKNALKQESQFLIDHEKFNILIHGTHFERKGVDLAVKAVDELNRENQGPYVLYITSHHIADAAERVKELTNDFASIQVIDVIENIKFLYDSVDLFISPSRDEAFGYAVVEAAYSNCQVAASDVSGQDTMKCIPNILWTHKESVESLKEAIQQAYYNKVDGSKDKLKSAQREQAIEQFGIGDWCKKNLNLYQKLLNR